jgi:predicted metal-dependent hydrolase
MVSGESHYFLGQRYRLRVLAYTGSPRIRCDGADFLDLFVRSETTVEQRRRILEDWYRERLRERIPPLLGQWQPVLGVRVADWGIKRMKTKWGSCNPKARRVWLNLELAKKPIQCLEYIVVHELVHLLERHHDERFTALMDTHLPQWRHSRELLNRAPLAHEEWGY